MGRTETGGAAAREAALDGGGRAEGKRDGLWAERTASERTSMAGGGGGRNGGGGRRRSVAAYSAGRVVVGGESGTQSGQSERARRSCRWFPSPPSHSLEEPSVVACRSGGNGRSGGR
ncbi:Os02g0703050 [Oryza sativa Japonica Group]|uniref:Os02g0703050 protein n=1 Tax=Oryza sativa subsp. japonica TaxID=39947 RepID=A0A0P0VNH0_ORYSJ|nr:Os02g0703050 [Oryza sativa Japonica Group]